MFARDPKRPLRSDYRPEDQNRLEKQLNSNNLAFYRCFSTPDGQRVLDILDNVTSKLVDTNIYITNANAGRRELVDLMKTAVQQGSIELSKLTPSSTRNEP